jgi:hypothetical protein
LEYWNTGILEYWNIGIPIAIGMEYWNFGIMPAGEAGNKRVE